MSQPLRRRDFLSLVGVGTIGVGTVGVGTAGLFVSPLAFGSKTSPLFQSKDVFTAGLDGIREYRIPAMVTTNKGTLLALCDARVEKPGDAPNNIDLALKRSVDNGETWERMKILIDFPGYQAACDACMLVDRQTGSIWIIYDHIWPTLESLEKANRTLPQGLQPDGRGRIIMLHAIVSDDDGQTWSQPRDITSMLTQPGWTGVMAAPGMGIQMRNGRLVVPCYFSRGKPATNERDHSTVAYSDDHGKTWQLGAGAGPATNECQVLELADGSLMLNMRSYHGKGCRAVATSRDGGKTWSELRHEYALIEPRCQGSFIRYTDRQGRYARNRLLFSNPAHKKDRVNMTVRLSYDEGRTWLLSKVIYPGPSAYSCLTALPDGTIGLLYENGRNEPYERITFARFNLEWLTDGKDQLAI